MRAYRYWQGAAFVAALMAPLQAAPQATPTAGNESVAETLTQWGIMGKWKVDCSTPPSESDMLETYARRGDGAVEERDFGSLNDSNPVRSAVINPDGSLTVVIEFSQSNAMRENTLVKSANGKRTIENRAVNTSDYSVRKGKLTGSGRPTPWFRHCL
jgi:hypothetical protein